MEKNIFTQIDPYKLEGENFFADIGKEWMLVSAKSDISGRANMMTASWGCMGILWNKNIVNIYVRPSRYTYNYLANNDYFTLNFLEDGNDNTYSFCGTKSGKDYDKVAETGLIPVRFSDYLYGFDKSKYIFLCKKIYSQPMSIDCFSDQESGKKLYPNDDVHTMFVAEIEKIYKKNS